MEVCLWSCVNLMRRKQWWCCDLVPVWLRLIEASKKGLKPPTLIVLVPCFLLNVSRAENETEIAKKEGRDSGRRCVCESQGGEKECRDIYRVVRERRRWRRGRKTLRRWGQRTGRKRVKGEKTKSEGVKGAGAKNVKSVHKYRGPEHITTVTRPLILTPAVLVAMDTSQLGTLPPPLRTLSHPLAFYWGTWPDPPEKAVIIRLSEHPCCHDVNIYIQSPKGLTAAPLVLFRLLFSFLFF